MKLIKKNKKKKIELPPFLYVGVDFPSSQEILKKGFFPIVGLSTVYSPYFAVYAALESKQDKCAIFEIKTANLDKSVLFPFHGFVELSKRKPIETEVNIINNRIKALENIELCGITWEASLNNCGVLIYKNSISIEEINKVAYFLVEDYKEYIQSSIGPWDTVYKLYGQNYIENEKLTKTIFEKS